MCSYCGCRDSLSIIARYSSEHDEIVNALGYVRRAVEAGEQVHQHCAQLRLQLTEHTASEERSMFAELRRDPEFTDVVDGLCREHDDLMRRLALIEAGETSEFAEFERMLVRHIDKEENGLFPAAIMALDGAAWDRAQALA